MTPPEPSTPPKPTGLRELNALAAGTHRCVNTRTLDHEGFDDDRIATLVRHGAMSRAVHSVYLVGDRVLTRAQSRSVGVLLGKAGTVIGGRTAAEHRGLLPWSDHRLDVIIPDARRTRTVTTLLDLEDNGRPVTIRLRGSIRVPEVDTVDGVPSATVARTLLDLAAAEGGEIAWKAWREAGFLRLLDHDALKSECGPGRAGSGIIRQLLEAVPVVQTEETDAQTAAEYALLEALIELGLPRPRSNQPMRLDNSWYFPDVHSVEYGAVVEVDGPIHKDPRRAAEDRLRNAHMRRHGIDVKRVDRDAVLADAYAQARIVYAWLTGPRPRPR